MSSYRPGALAASLRPLLQQQLGEFGRVAAIVSGADLALRLQPFTVDDLAATTEAQTAADETSEKTCFQRIRANIGKIINSTWLERLSIVIVFINCVTLTFHRPCVERVTCDAVCVTWKLVDKIALAFFLFEMLAQLIHKGILPYLKDHWHYLDIMIVVFGLLEEVLLHFQINLASIRAMRILRPVRTIEWIPSVRLLVALLWDTLPMLANVFLLSVFFFVVFGIMAVQLWAGVLRQRCYHTLNLTTFPQEFPGLDAIRKNQFYVPTIGDFLCTLENGLHHCSSIPSSRSFGFGKPCSLSVEEALTEWHTKAGTLAFYYLNNTNMTTTTTTTTARITTTTTLPSLSDCINWNRVYNECRGNPESPNPFEGAISFDNVLMAWISIFQVITLEGWSDIMYHLQDAHSFWVFLYFVPLILFGSYFLVNLCLACITIQLARSQYLYYTQNTHKHRSSLLQSTTVSTPPIAGAILDHWTVAGVRRAVNKMINQTYLFMNRNIGKTFTITAVNIGDCRNNISLLNNGDVFRTPRPQLIRQPAMETYLDDTTRRSFFSNHRSFSFATLHGNQQIPDNRALSNAQKRCFASGSSYSFDTGTMLARLRDPSTVESFVKIGDSSNYCNKPNTNDDSLFGDEEDVFLDPEATSNSGSSNYFDIPDVPMANEASVIVHAVGSTANSSSKRSSFVRQDAICLDGDNRRDRLLLLPNHQLGVIGDDIEAINDSEVVTATSLPLRLGTEFENNTENTRIADKFRLFRWFHANIYMDEHLVRFRAMVLPYCKKWRTWLTGLLKQPVSDYFFMYCITINTVSLAVEHHDQPRVLSIIVNSINVLFTLVFAVELLCKVICFGPSYCAQSVFNAIDTVVVFFTLLDLFSDTTFAVFRAFRLVRLFKLIDFMPSLRNTLASLFRVVDSAITFLIFLFICMYVFALFGTFLLGGRLCETEFGEPCLCGQPPPGATQCSCNRKNFDSFFSSMMSVFQIFTQESWNELLYESMTKLSPWIAVYYITLVMVGNFVLLNLLIAILVSGFLERAIAQNPVKSGILAMAPKRSDSTGPRSALAAIKDKLKGVSEGKDKAKPQKPLKDEPEMGATMKIVANNRRRSSSLPMLTPDKNINTQQQGSNKQQHRHRSQSTPSARSDSSEKFEMASLGRSRATVTNENGFCKYQHRFASFSITSSSITPMPSDYASALDGNILFSPETSRRMFQTPAISVSNGVPSVPSIVALDNNVGTATVQQTTTINVNEERKPMRATVLCSQLFEIVAKHLKAEMKVRATWSFFFLPPENCLRRSLGRVVEHRFFEGCVLALIAANCVAIAIESPNIDPESTLRKGLDIVNNVMTILFTTEMMAKMIVFGVVLGPPNAYLRSGWNVMDCVLVVVCFSEMIITSLLKGSSSQILNALRVLRMLRALRPLRVINSSRSLRLIVETVFSSMSEIGTVVLICFFFFLIYAIFGVQQFHGCLGRCRGNNVTNVHTRVECLLAGNRWVNDFYNFDNVFVALQTLFVFATFDNWMSIMFSGVDCVGIDKQPQENYSPIRMIYFLTFIIFCGFFLLNIFVGVVVSNFQRNFDNMKARDAAAAAFRHQIEITAMATVTTDPSKKKAPRRRSEFDLREALARNGITPQRVGAANHRRPPRNSLGQTAFSEMSTHSLIRLRCCNGVAQCRSRFRFIATHTYFDLASGIAILLNVILMTVEHYNMSPELDRFITNMSYCFTVIFGAEMSLRLTALGCRRYFREGWNIFDSVIVITSLASTVFEEMSRHELPLNATLVRVMRIAKFARVLKVLRVANTMHRILDTVGKSLLQVGHLSLLIVLVFFIYAALGVELFGRLNWHATQMDRDCQPGQYKCHVLGEHANFQHMGMAMLTLFRILTGDNWSGLMKDIAQLPCDAGPNCQTAPILSYLNATLVIKPGTPRNENGDPLFCCVPSLLPSIYFMSFVLVTTLCLLNLVVAVIMGSLEDSYGTQQQDDSASSSRGGMAATKSGLLGGSSSMATLDAPNKKL